MKQLAYIKQSTGEHWVGDGFPVRNLFSYNDLAEELSPFLLLDYAGPAHFDPTSARRGVGAHPHRGFETVTLVYAGGVSHHDSGGNGGTLGPGDVQWMTAGAGVLHEEYHSAEYARQGGPFEMVQLWVNLPARHKLVAPAYQQIGDAQIPRVTLPDGAGSARVIAGRLGTTRGPARSFTALDVWDLRLRAGRALALDLPVGHTAALFVLRGAIVLGGRTVRAAELAVLERHGSRLELEARDESVVLLLGGAPLDEPIAAQGPFVMNTREEIAQALRDYAGGRFARMPASGNPQTSTERPFHALARDHDLEGDDR